MKKNIKINSQTYSGIEKVILKDTENNDVAFSETSDATAVSSDIKSGKTAYVLGEKVTGSHVCPSAPSATLVEKSITQNGVYSASDENADGFSEVTVNVPSGSGSVLVEKTITQNGTFNASADSADGYSSVTVNVPSSAVTPSGALNISENGTFDVTNYASAIVNVAAALQSDAVKSGSISFTGSDETKEFVHGFSASPRMILLLKEVPFLYNEHVALFSTAFTSNSGDMGFQICMTAFLVKSTSDGTISVNKRDYSGAVTFDSSKITVSNAGSYKLAGSFKWYAFA